MNKMWVKESKFSKMLPPDSGPNNAYGLLVGLEEDGRMLPYSCGHGGSMWLCYNCAEAIAEDRPLPKKSCPWHGSMTTYECATSSCGCTWPGCCLNFMEGSSL